MGFGSFWGQTGWPCSKHGSQRQKLLRSSWNWNLVKPNLSLLWHSTVPNLLNGTGSWFQQLYLMASLRMSRRSGQSELKRCVYLTDRIANFVTWTVANCWINWHLTVAKCAVPSGLSQRLCLNKRAVKICVAKSAECIDSWFHQLYLMASLRMSRRSGQSELKRCVHLTDRITNFVTWTVANGWINWHLTVAKCAKCAVPSGLSQRLCLNKRAVRICVAGCFNWREGDPFLVSVTLHSHITLSPATFHPVQCRANMRVADCSTVWVCKCLQLIYLPALHLTLFDIYSTI